MLQQIGYTPESTVILIFQYFHLMYSEVAWVQVSSGTQVQLSIILDPDYLNTVFLFLCYNKVTNLEIKMLDKCGENW